MATVGNGLAELNIFIEGNFARRSLYRNGLDRFNSGRMVDVGIGGRIRVASVWSFELSRALQDSLVGPLLYLGCDGFLLFFRPRAERGVVAMVRGEERVRVL